LKSLSGSLVEAPSSRISREHLIMCELLISVVFFFVAPSSTGLDDKKIGFLKTSFLLLTMKNCPIDVEKLFLQLL
jgi:hypothetical protein